jgi:hypothetical protein
MRNAVLWGSVLIFGLSGCAASSDEADIVKEKFGENCENAKYQLDSAVENGQLTNLRALKENIELYCVWRRN